MNFHILTLFPEMVENGLKTSIIGRAVAGGLLSIEAVNIRDFAFNKHQSVDDYPYGGGAGMLMQAEPVYLAYKDIEERITKRIQDGEVENTEAENAEVENAEAENGEVQNAEIQDAETVSSDKKLRVVYLSPQGKTFDQKMAEELAAEEDLVLLCGHYEGIDERVLEEIVTDYVSIGDYVLTGGELPAMVMVDTISRLVPGVLHNDVSAEFESFQDNLLEYPQYSRPEEWHGKKVPPVLLSGHHANIEKWRREQSILRTYERRPDLLEKSTLTWKEKKWLEETVKEKTVQEESEEDRVNLPKT
ncbi:tRNA (guanosine(37)-N1)-methyltransferase TrmD [[Ruminococcus] torques]|uniref:tRNA (guanosine(37)-N1)-methyltransferase TrmD n=1 Tax=[Ruminococcus] torques TaxID=33039 RepID=UPI00242AC0A2|nr:tRNA (guanosine(37)-N1)-methyltransferase TrmD [[Ruminococcus] torques]